MKTTGKRHRSDFLEAARNAISGYTTVVLAIVCFILTLMVIMAVVRLVAGISLAASSPATVQTSTQIVGRS